MRCALAALAHGSACAGILGALSLGACGSPAASPTCFANGFSIDSAPDTTSLQAHFVWWLDSSPNQAGGPVNRISSPLDYSTRPEQVILRVAPRSLVSGVQYRVSITAYDELGRVRVSSKLFVR